HRDLLAQGESRLDGDQQRIDTVLVGQDGDMRLERRMVLNLKHGTQFCLTLLPLRMTSLEALQVILPEPSMVMSLPLMVMVPSFFMVILASPVVSVMESAAVMARALPT